MTMPGTMPDEVGKLVDDSLAPNPPNMLQEMVQALRNFILPTHEELITQLRAPTPIKVSKILAIPAGGSIGGGVAFPDLSQIIYTAPESAEAWLHRITITSPEHSPNNPLGGGGQTTQTINPANPAAGANFFSTPSATQSVQLLQVQYTLTTSAAVANRQAGITVNGVLFQSPATQAASLTATYVFMPGVPATTGAVAAGSTNYTPIPPGMIVPPGNLVNSSVLNLQAGDTITAISVMFLINNTTAPELVLVGSTFGEILLSLPEIQNNYQVAPTQFVEGRLSAPHLDRGESLSLSGDGLTAGNHIRVDLQIVLVTGASEFTPRRMSPSDLTRRGAPNSI